MAEAPTIEQGKDVTVVTEQPERPKAPSGVLPGTQLDNAELLDRVHKKAKVSSLAALEELAGKAESGIIGSRDPALGTKENFEKIKKRLDEFPEPTREQVAAADALWVQHIGGRMEFYNNPSRTEEGYALWKKFQEEHPDEGLIMHKYRYKIFEKPTPVLEEEETDQQPVSEEPAEPPTMEPEIPQDEGIQHTLEEVQSALPENGKAWIEEGDGQRFIVQEIPGQGTEIVYSESAPPLLAKKPKKKPFPFKEPAFFKWYRETLIQPTAKHLGEYFRETGKAIGNRINRREDKTPS